MSWEALIAQFVPHPGCGPNSIYTRIKLCEKQFWSFIAWPFSWSLEYCALVLNKSEIVGILIQSKIFFQLSGPSLIR